MVCETCLNQITDFSKLNEKHWFGLSELMWSLVPAIQVISWCIIDHLKSHKWAADLLDQLYLDDELMTWA